MRQFFLILAVIFLSKICNISSKEYSTQSILQKGHFEQSLDPADSDDKNEIEDLVNFAKNFDDFDLDDNNDLKSGSDLKLNRESFLSTRVKRQVRKVRKKRKKTVINLIKRRRQLKRRRALEKKLKRRRIRLRNIKRFRKIRKQKKQAAKLKSSLNSNTSGNNKNGTKNGKNRRNKQRNGKKPRKNPPKNRRNKKRVERSVQSPESKENFDRIFDHTYNEGQNGVDKMPRMNLKQKNKRLQMIRRNRRKKQRQRLQKLKRKKIVQNVQLNKAQILKNRRRIKQIQLRKKRRKMKKFPPKTTVTTESTLSLGQQPSPSNSQTSIPILFPPTSSGMIEQLQPTETLQIVVTLRPQAVLNKNQKLKLKLRNRNKKRPLLTVRPLKNRRRRVKKKRIPPKRKNRVIRNRLKFKNKRKVQRVVQRNRNKNRNRNPNRNKNKKVGPKVRLRLKRLRNRRRNQKNRTKAPAIVNIVLNDLTTSTSTTTTSTTSTPKPVKDSDFSLNETLYHALQLAHKNFENISTRTTSEKPLRNTTIRGQLFAYSRITTTSTTPPTTTVKLDDDDANYYKIKPDPHRIIKSDSSQEKNTSSGLNGADVELEDDEKDDYNRFKSGLNLDDGIGIDISGISGENDHHNGEQQDQENEEPPLNENDHIITEFLQKMPQTIESLDRIRQDKIQQNQNISPIIQNVENGNTHEINDHDHDGSKVPVLLQYRPIDSNENDDQLLVNPILSQLMDSNANIPLNRQDLNQRKRYNNYLKY